MFVNDFYKNKEHDYNSFFSGYSDNKALKAAKSEMKEVAKILEEKRALYLAELAKRYNSHFTPITGEYVFRYEDRSCITHYYDGTSGNTCDYKHSGEEDVVYVTLPKKNGTIATVVGYSFELGAAVVREYNYHVSTNNSQLNLVFTFEYLIPLLEPDAYVLAYNCGSTETTPLYFTRTDIMYNYSRSEIQTALQRVKATEFINTFYGLEKTFSFSLFNMIEYLTNNKSFETLIKTVEDKKALSLLLPISCDKAVAAYKLIGVDKTAWNYAIKHNCCEDFIKFKQTFPSSKYDRVAKRFNEVYDKTDIEWIDFIEKTKHWQEDLNFYGFRETCLFNTLITAFAGLEYPYNNISFFHYYSFNKFCSYVVEESINQGYTSLDNFIRTLSDYINMCKDLEVVPTLFSSYLSQTHDIVSRNHKISISPTQEKAFKERYIDFKKYSTKDSLYSIIAPKCSLDLRKEGDNLNHCVASYIKRVIDGDCLIFFLRLTQAITDSLVTVEVRNGAVVQARGLHNRDIDSHEKSALNQFCKERKLDIRI